MLTSNLTVISQSGMDLTVQTLETTETHLLLRLRSATRVPSRHKAQTDLAAAHEQFSLSDVHGTTVMKERGSSLSEGPFGGIPDLAFPLDGGLDMSSPLTLKSENAEVTFQI